MALNLSTTTHSLEIVTTVALALDVTVSFVDVTTTTQTPGSQTTAISTATTTVVVAAPAASTQRVINDIEIVNRGAGSQTVTVQKDVSATDFRVYGPVTLAQNERVQFTSDRGWRRFDANGGEIRGGPSVFHWNNFSPEPVANVAVTTNSVWLFPLPYNQIFPGNMTVNTLNMGLSISGTVASGTSIGYTMRLGLYTLANSTQLSLLNSASAVFSSTTGASMASFFSGNRMFPILSSQWSSQPVLTEGHYWLGIVLSTAGNTAYSQSYRAVSAGGGTFQGIIGNSNTTLGYEFYPFHGAFASANIPTSIGASAVAGGNNYGSLIPVVQLLNGIQTA